MVTQADGSVYLKITTTTNGEETVTMKKIFDGGGDITEKEATVNADGTIDNKGQSSYAAGSTTSTAAEALSML